MARQILSAGEQSLVKAAIETAERKTAGEIIVVVTPSCDDYLPVPVLWAALAALLVPLPISWLTSLSAANLYLLQLGLFAALSLVLSIRAIRLAITPGSLKRKHAHRTAVEQFLARELHTTRSRTGVLIFVALAERYCEVIADKGIAEKIEQRFWNELVAAMTARIGSGKLGEGLAEAVDRCGDILAQHVPPSAGDRNELPDHLIVLEE
ncbi:MAG: TPM domain-containing protein [Pseudomonadota bacterium]|nr:TPM domain-containing protein [Pseudomonadota bacterium]